MFKLTLVAIFFVTFTQFSIKPLCAQPWVEERVLKDDAIEIQIANILQSFSMFSSEERQDLKKAVTKLKDAHLGVSELAGISYAFIVRIERDRDRIRTLIYYLKKMKQNNYLLRFGQLKVHEIKKLQDQHNLNGDALSKVKKNMGAYKKPIAERDYVRSIQELYDLLAGSHKASIEKNWNRSKGMAGRYYKTWDRRYDMLWSKKKESSQEAFPTKVLTFDENEFVQTFRELQAHLRRITPSKSKDF